MRFTVKRKTWLRGKFGSGLLVQGKRCCIGFVCKQLGIKDAEMRLAATVNELAKNGSVLPVCVTPLLLKRKAHALGAEKRWVKDAYNENDDDMINDAEREAKLKKLFKRGGHSVVFV